MRHHQKGAEPQVLTENKNEWQAAYLADKGNATARYRYRHPEIKNSLLTETGHKCIYCESKIGHNTPGDVEHKAPSSLYEYLHFDWTNLTIACTECNRRKGAYDTVSDPFLDPYLPDIEARIAHHGPVVVSAAGDVGAEIGVRRLELDRGRNDLMERKVEKIVEINHLKNRIIQCGNPILRELLEADLNRRCQIDQEFSGMVRSLI
ncbi:MAG: HNH endonuclease [Alphaproteobacteria bacterium]|nr:HNH endonuclease [Alphaproteobacteria bacterium]MBU0865102.1 HNH endonuclease [Alphaproteobacteria bacterium]MBU1826753.1 HNH endonuclease [Alphaproteobacteria bacterium]